MVKKEIKKRVPKEKAAVKEPVKHVAKVAGRYVEGIGRRKTAIARVRVTGGSGKFVVNDKNVEDYFYIPRIRTSATLPLEKLKVADKFDVSAHVRGGGPRAQGDAVRMGLSRALAAKNEDFKRLLSKLGFLTRDSRMVERKKYGLKKARRAPQWQKR